jgi:CarD family transcriptional regulator
LTKKIATKTSGAAKTSVGKNGASKNGAGKIGAAKSVAGKKGSAKNLAALRAFVRPTSQSAATPRRGRGKAAVAAEIKRAMAARALASKGAQGRIVVVRSIPTRLELPPVIAKHVAAKPIAAKPAAAKLARQQLGFSTNDYVVYPTHGVGRIIGMERQEISGSHLDLFVVEFEKDKMVLRVPVSKVSSVGLRRLSSPQVMRSALETLKGRARIKRTMWSRRAQEYEAKINSGDPVSIAEVVRDLHRNAGQPDQSYSERQIYESALDRLAREFAAVERIDETAAAGRLEKVLRPNPA